MLRCERGDRQQRLEGADGLEPPHEIRRDPHAPRLDRERPLRRPHQQRADWSEVDVLARREQRDPAGEPGDLARGGSRPARDRLAQFSKQPALKRVALEDTEQPGEHVEVVGGFVHAVRHGVCTCLEPQSDRALYDHESQRDGPVTPVQCEDDGRKTRYGRKHGQNRPEATVTQKDWLRGPGANARHVHMLPDHLALNRGKLSNVDE